MPSEPFVRISEGGGIANTSTTDTFRSDANTFGNLGGSGPAISNYPSDVTALANVDHEGPLDANGENGGAQSDTVGNNEQMAGTSAALEQSVDSEEINEPSVGPERRRNSSDSSSPDQDREFDEDVMPGDTHPDDDAPASPACEPWGPTCADLEDARGGARSTFPIVLVHGFMGWDRVLWVDYFYQIPQRLRAAGYTVFVPTTDPINSSEVRSHQLSEQVDRFLECSCAEKLNFIAHSQGGIDVRHLMGPLGYAERTASLTTIATPHNGFRLADEALSRSPAGVQFLSLLGSLVSRAAIGQPDDTADLRRTLQSLSKETMGAFNQRWPDPPDVSIYSFAGFSGLLSDGGRTCQRGERPSPRRGDIVEPALLATYALSGGHRTPNDGLIPVEDCIRGRWLGCISADHWDQVGHAFGLTDAFDHVSFYLQHAAFLVQQGH